MLLDQSNDLISLAKSRAPADRERLLMGVVSLCERSPSGAEGLRARELIDQVFLALVMQAERDVRRRLAERIADAAWAPRALINILALDEIEIAKPIIAASPILQDSDLIRLLVQATLEHQIEVARRPNIDAAVVEAILQRSEPDALVALARNESAQISVSSMGQLVDSARRLPALRAPLSRHPKLTEALGQRLFTWVGDALRTALVERFQLDEAALSAAIDQAVTEVAAAEPAEPAKPVERTQEREAAEQALVEKLDAAGQLKAGYLLRALQEHKLSLFEAGLARLAGLDVGDLRRALASDRPELLALACMAASIDRGVFPALLAKVRELNAGRPGGGADGVARAQNAFQCCASSQAAENFRRILSVI